MLQIKLHPEIQMDRVSKTRKTRKRKQSKNRAHSNPREELTRPPANSIRSIPSRLGKTLDKNTHKQGNARCKKFQACARDSHSRGDLGSIFAASNGDILGRECVVVKSNIVAALEPERECTVVGLNAKRTIEQTVQANANLGHHIRHRSGRRRSMHLSSAFLPRLERQTGVVVERGLWLRRTDGKGYVRMSRGPRIR